MYRPFLRQPEVSLNYTNIFSFIPTQFQCVYLLPPSLPLSSWRKGVGHVWDDAFSKYISALDSYFFYLIVCLGCCLLLLFLKVILTAYYSLAIPLPCQGSKPFLILKSHSSKSILNPFLKRIDSKLTSANLQFSSNAPEQNTWAKPERVLTGPAIYPKIPLLPSLPPSSPCYEMITPRFHAS